MHMTYIVLLKEHETSQVEAHNHISENLKDPAFYTFILIFYNNFGRTIDTLAVCTPYILARFPKN